MKNLNLTTDEILVILESISDSMDEIYGGPEGLSECMKIELEIMNNLKRKLEKLL
jgi:hypothetical protein